MYTPENLQEIKSYRPAILVTGKLWYVEYYVYNPIQKKLVRLKIKLNHIPLGERKNYGRVLAKNMNIQLEQGWNPFKLEQNSRSYSPLVRAIDDWLRMIDRKFDNGDIRTVTRQGYISKMKILKEYLQEKKLTGIYVYNMNKDFILHFLDYVMNDRLARSRTRDNYLKTIRLFCTYLVERGFIKVNFANEITVMGKAKRGPKNRSVINDKLRERISTFLHDHNKHFLLASELLYFCMVRPKEMTYIKISHVDLAKGTLFIPGETAKNYKDAVVTLPQVVTSLISELQIMDNPGEYYLFSDDFKPGEKYRRQKQFNDYWHRVVRHKLKLTLDIKLYSLKDSGITDMIRKYNDPIIARDQARHHDLSITNIYTPQDMMEANETIRKDERKF